MKAAKGDDERTTAGLREFLRMLPEDEVLGLLKTTTNGQVMKSSKDEGIAELIKWSDAVTVLNRRRVTKDYMMRYLLKKDVKFSTSANKTALCQLILKTWEWAQDKDIKSLVFTELLEKPKALLSIFDGSKGPFQPAITGFMTKSIQQRTMPEIPSAMIKPSSTELKETKPKLEIPSAMVKPATTELKESKPKLDGLPIPKPDEIPESAKKAKLEDFSKAVVPYSPAAALLPISVLENQQDKDKVKGPTTKVMCEMGTNTDPCTTISVCSYDEVEHLDYDRVVSLRRKEQDQEHLLGVQFSKWYYDRYNHQTEFFASHFWSECNLRVECVPSNILHKRKITEFLHDGQRCYEEMCCLRSKHKVFLGPNLLTGVRAKMSPHGLVQIVVCGIVYQPDETGKQIGVFEQVFGLTKDPSCPGDNFKIKFTLLRLREDTIVNSVNQPALCDHPGVIEEIDDHTDDEIDEEAGAQEKAEESLD